MTSDLGSNSNSNTSDNNAKTQHKKNDPLEVSSNGSEIVPIDSSDYIKDSVSWTSEDRFENGLYRRSKKKNMVEKKDSYDSNETKLQN